MPKCEHGLTSAECYVCASPKRGAEPVWVKGELPPRYIARSPIQAEPVQEPHHLCRPLTEREKAAIAPPHPGDFGIPKAHWQAAQAYAEWWHENRKKAQRPAPSSAK